MVHGILFSAVSLDTILFLIRNSRQCNPYCGRDGSHLSDSAGTGAASIPNHLHHLASDLFMEGAYTCLLKKASNLEDVKRHQHILFVAVRISPPSTPINYCTTTRTQTQTTILSQNAISQPGDAQATSLLQNHLQKYFANFQHLYSTNFFPIGFNKDMLSSKL